MRSFQANAGSFKDHKEGLVQFYIEQGLNSKAYEGRFLKKNWTFLSKNSE